MGILDSISDSFNRGSDAVGRSMSTMKLESQIKELNRQRTDLAAQLGASLYDTVKDDPKFREGREELFDGIAELDRKREEAQAEIARIEAEAAAAAQARMTYTCPKCGNKLNEGDKFCAGCGMPADEVKAAIKAAEEAAKQPAGPACPSCGATIAEGDKFCMNCGAKIEAPAEPAPTDVPAENPVQYAAPAPAPAAPAPAPAPAAAPAPAPSVSAPAPAPSAPAPAPMPSVSAPAPAVAPEASAPAAAPASGTAISMPPVREDASVESSEE